jgi:hypothetical protein
LETKETAGYNCNQEGMHTVWIYKATEAHTGPIFIEKITGQDLKPLKRPEAPLIEFIGNSITCGAAADPPKHHVARESITTSIMLTMLMGQE